MTEASRWSRCSTSTTRCSTTTASSPDMMHYLDAEVGHERQQRYWAIFEDLRKELGYADYLGALQRYRVENPRDSHLLAVSSFLVNYPFAEPAVPRTRSTRSSASGSGARWSSCPTATWSSSRARSSARGCRRRWTATS